MKKINLWFILSTIFVLLIILPNLEIIFYLFKPVNDTWIHIKTYLLKDYIITTFKLCLFVGVFSVSIGVTTAYLITVYEFPFRGFFRWAMILPLSIPPYVAAYTYSGLLSYTGNIQVFLRNTLKVSNSNWGVFNILSETGAIFIFTMFLFPYAYMIVYSYFKKESATLIESSRLLGKNGIETFFKVVLPHAHIVIIASLSLILLEVLSDYGVVSYFGVQTLSTAIFTSWFSFADSVAALRLAGLLLMSVFAIITLEKILRGRKKYTLSSTKIRPITRKEVRGVKKVLIPLYCFIVLSFGFFIPTLQLIEWAIYSYKEVLNFKLLVMIRNSIFVSVVASLVIISMAVIIANYTRIAQNKCSLLYSKITLLGYSIPGTVVAITVILFFNSVDRNMLWFYKIFNENTKTLILSTSIVMLLFAYTIRFLGVGFQSIEGGFEKVGKKFYEASKTLGHSTVRTFFLVDLPMLKPAIISAFSLVFVDIIKELPLTLLLRPFNFDTLATKVFTYAHDELIISASIPSLFIIAVALIAIFLINKTIDREVN